MEHNAVFPQKIICMVFCSYSLGNSNIFLPPKLSVTWIPLPRQILWILHQMHSLNCTGSRPWLILSFHSQWILFLSIPSKPLSVLFLLIPFSYRKPYQLCGVIEVYKLGLWSPEVRNLTESLGLIITFQRVNTLHQFSVLSLAGNTRSENLQINKMIFLPAVSTI